MSESPRVPTRPQFGTAIRPGAARASDKVTPPKATFDDDSWDSIADDEPAPAPVAAARTPSPGATPPPAAVKTTPKPPSVEATPLPTQGKSNASVGTRTAVMHAVQHPSASSSSTSASSGGSSTSSSNLSAVSSGPSSSASNLDLRDIHDTVTTAVRAALGRALEGPIAPLQETQDQIVLRLVKLENAVRELRASMDEGNKAAAVRHATREPPTPVHVHVAAAAPVVAVPSAPISQPVLAPPPASQPMPTQQLVTQPPAFAPMYQVDIPDELMQPRKSRVGTVMFLLLVLVLGAIGTVVAMSQQH